MMNVSKIFTALFLLFFICGINYAQEDSVNLALDATVTTSYVSSWESLAAVNDGYDPTSSTKTGGGGSAYGNWSGDDGGFNWVQYEWDNAVNISSTSVYWWDNDPGDVGIAQPDTAYVEYWNGASWTSAGEIGTDLDTYNTLYIGGEWTQKIRITMKSPAATGILEWKVYGKAGGDCEPVTLNTIITANSDEPDTTNMVSLLVGDNLKLEAFPSDSGQYNWNGPNGFTASGSQVEIENIQALQAGTYTISLINNCGSVSEAVVYVTVNLTNDGSAYTWPAYDPPIYYDFKDEYPTLEEPTQDLLDVEASGEIGGRISSGWWTFAWGPKAKSLVTEAAIYPMLERYNQDFAYFRDTMGWPPDKRAKRGYRSAIYLYGSGLSTDNADSTALGGWQSSLYYQGETWEHVLASYYPVYCFDPSCPYSDRETQMGGMIHEGIHSVLADLPGAKNAAWFQEGGNTWLQQEMESQKSGDFSSMGYLNAGALIAPFMPIECYSGWLQDGSFGGPSAEGVNMYSGSQQICTWRNLLGGNQYGNLFPVLFSQIFGNHSVAWIWRYCENRVLDGIADTLGDSQTRRLIMEYRAKQALVDFGEWTSAATKLLDSYFGTSIGSEWEPYWINAEKWKATPYVKTWINSSGLVVPEQRTTPGWSGANIIPLVTEGDMVSVDFIPLDKNMGCQICYRDVDGEVVYGQPVFGGECKLKLDKTPANDVVFVVVTNTDYVYEGEETRKAHFDYRLKLGEGVKERAHWNVKWYRWDRTLSNITIPTSIDETSYVPNSVSVYPNPVSADKAVNIRFLKGLSAPAEVRLVDMNGKFVTRMVTSENTTLALPEQLSSGFYFVVVKTNEGTEVHKLVVQ